MPLPLIFFPSKLFQWRIVANKKNFLSQQYDEKIWKLSVTTSHVLCVSLEMCHLYSQVGKNILLEKYVNCVIKKMNFIICELFFAALLLLDCSFYSFFSTFISCCFSHLVMLGGEWSDRGISFCMAFTVLCANGM